jgi:hypothetical protein
MIKSVLMYGRFHGCKLFCSKSFAILLQDRRAHCCLREEEAKKASVALSQSLEALKLNRIS